MLSCDQYTLKMQCRALQTECRHSRVWQCLQCQSNLQMQLGLTTGRVSLLHIPPQTLLALILVCQATCLVKCCSISSDMRGNSFSAHSPIMRSSSRKPLWRLRYRSLLTNACLLIEVVAVALLNVRMLPVLKPPVTLSVAPCELAAWELCRALVKTCCMGVQEMPVCEAPPAVAPAACLAQVFR